MKVKTTKGYISVEEAAKLYGLTPARIDYLVKLHRLPKMAGADGRLTNVHHTSFHKVAVIEMAYVDEKSNEVEKLHQLLYEAEADIRMFLELITGIPADECHTSAYFNGGNWEAPARTLRRIGNFIGVPAIDPPEEDLI